MEIADGRGARWRALARRLRSWPVVVGLVAFLIHLPYVKPGGPWARKPDATILSQDEGTVLYDSLRITRGQVMYKDFFMFQGPVFFYGYAGLFAITGPSFAAARVLHLLTTAIGAAFLAIVVSRFAGKIAGCGAAAIHACVLLPMWPFTYPHWLAETFALGALVLLTRPDRKARDELIAGALLALSLMTIQSVGLPVLVAVACVLAAPGLAARDWREALVRPGRILAGATAVLTPIALYFAAHGALGDLYYAMFRWSVENYKIGQGDQVTYGWWTKEAIALHRAALHAPWSTLAIFGLRLTWVLPFCALIAAPVVAIWALWKIWKKTAGFEFATAGGAALAGVSPLYLAPIRPDLTHVAYLGSFGLVAAAVLIGPIARRDHRAQLGVAALFAIAGALCLGTYAHKTARTWEPSRKLADWRGEARKLSAFATIEKGVPPGDTIVAGAMGGFYYFYLRDSAIPNTYMPGTYAKLLTDTQWQRIADAIATRRPWALLLVGVQWKEIAARRPDLATMYHPGSGLWLRNDPVVQP